MKQRRWELREKMTPAEQILWSRLRKRRLKGHKFRNQHGIGPYIADFYHPKSMTVIEIDGSIHNDPEVASADKWREGYLKDLGYRILRFTNNEVINDIESVLQNILKSIQPLV